MARPRKIIPDIVGINMVELASKILKMNDAEIGAWLRKAVGDCINGCQDPDCDLFIKVQYDNTVEEMQKRQAIDAQKYRRRLERQGKTLATTPCKTISTEPVVGDGDIRKESQDRKSGTSPTTSISTDAVSKTLAGAAPKRENGLDKSPVSLSGEAPASTAQSDTAAKHPYGTCGHVMLTDAEGHHLREVYGKNLVTAIDILDAYIENNGKAAKRYKNHAAVLRKGNWVWRTLQESILKEKCIEKASMGPRNFKAEERERTARVLRGESADGKGYVRDDELTPAELEAKYG